VIQVHISLALAPAMHYVLLQSRVHSAYGLHGHPSLFSVDSVARQESASPQFLGHLYQILSSEAKSLHILILSERRNWLNQYFLPGTWAIHEVRQFVPGLAMQRASEQQTHTHGDLKTQVLSQT
jgi:hypothetical protein